MRRARARAPPLITAAREKRCSRRARLSRRHTAARCSPSSRAAFYLPGVAPKDFTAGERVELKVNKLTSTRTHLPYDYYSQVRRARARGAPRAALSRCVSELRGGGGGGGDESRGDGARSRAQKFCKPHGGVKKVAENLGELLSGDSIESSPYQLFMKKDEFCKVLCEVNLDKKDVERFKSMVKEDYHHNWIIDNLPAASVIDTDQFITTSYSRGFPIGYMDKLSKNPYLYNHVNIIIKYHQIDVDAFRVVGFYVEPFTVKHEYEDAETDLTTTRSPRSRRAIRTRRWSSTR